MSFKVTKSNIIGSLWTWIDEPDQLYMITYYNKEYRFVSLINGMGFNSQTFEQTKQRCKNMSYAGNILELDAASYLEEVKGYEI